MNLIYIDASHAHQDVSQDALISGRKVKPGGLIVFNDYVLYDPFLNSEYGVVPAVNEMINSGQWRIVEFALQKHMFCDIAVARA